MMKVLSQATVIPTQQAPVRAPQPQVEAAPAAKSHMVHDNLSLTTRSGFGIVDMGLVNQPQGALVDNSKLSPRHQALRNSAAFRTVYRNFDLVPDQKQTLILNKLDMILAKYPNFLTDLGKVQAPEHGDGFQFFFTPPNQNPRWESLPIPIRYEKGEETPFIGVVYSHPVDAFSNDNPVKVFMKSVTHLGVEARKHIDPKSAGMDIGGMYTYVSEDTFSHEMGHVLHSYMMDKADRGEIWAIFSEAQRTGEGFITGYSETNHYEFFAEAVEAYTYQNHKGEFTQRKRLQEVNPHLFEFTRRLMEPGVGGQGQDPYVSTFQIARQKTIQGGGLLKNLGNWIKDKVTGDGNQKGAAHQGCNCDHNHGKTIEQRMNEYQAQ